MPRGGVRFIPSESANHELDFRHSSRRGTHMYR